MKPETPRLAVRVTGDALRQIRGGHPWIYDRSITSIKPEGRAGDLAVVFDNKRRFAAIGLYDPDSPVAIRILHQGKPTTIDQTWLTTRFGDALHLRRRLIDDPDTNALRLIHGENDGLGGLVVDHYHDTSVIKLYTTAWVPHVDSVLAALTATLAGDGLPYRRAVLRLGRLTASEVRGGVGSGDDDLADGVVIDGDPIDGPVRFRENGLAMEADVIDGHKTGHFLDQRDNRMLVRGHSAGRRVLDVFSCTGGFTINALAGGAGAVTATDRSGPALATVKANVDLNGLPSDRLTIIEGDAFDVMGRLGAGGRRFDVVVVDPPSFAQKADQVSGAVDAYRRLARLAAELVVPGGLLFQASCSSRVDVATFARAVDNGLADAGRERGRELITETGHAADHPIGFEFGSYLKARLLRLR